MSWWERDRLHDRYHPPGCGVPDVQCVQVLCRCKAGPVSGADPDVQHRYLLDAARSVEAHAEGDDSELAAKALHLVACVAAVDHMCREGDLPGEWRAER